MTTTQVTTQAEASQNLIHFRLGPGDVVDSSPKHSSSESQPDSLSGKSLDPVIEHQQKSGPAEPIKDPDLELGGELKTTHEESTVEYQLIRKRRAPTIAAKLLACIHGNLTPTSSPASLLAFEFQLSNHAHPLGKSLAIRFSFRNQDQSGDKLEPRVIAFAPGKNVDRCFSHIRFLFLLLGILRPQHLRTNVPQKLAKIALSECSKAS